MSIEKNVCSFRNNLCYTAKLIIHYHTEGNFSPREKSLARNCSLEYSYRQLCAQKSVALSEGFRLFDELMIYYEYSVI